MKIKKSRGYNKDNYLKEMICIENLEDIDRINYFKDAEFFGFKEEDINRFYFSNNDFLVIPYEKYVDFTRNRLKFNEKIITDFQNFEKIYEFDKSSVKRLQFFSNLEGMEFIEKNSETIDFRKDLINHFFKSKKYKDKTIFHFLPDFLTKEEFESLDSSMKSKIISLGYPINGSDKEIFDFVKDVKVNKLYLSIKEEQLINIIKLCFKEKNKEFLKKMIYLKEKHYYFDDLLKINDYYLLINLFFTKDVNFIKEILSIYHFSKEELLRNQKATNTIKKYNLEKYLEFLDNRKSFDVKSVKVLKKHP